jgi:predicted  nucleic acid-binding Zn-ribbon protein
MYFRSFYRCPDCSHEWMNACSERISDDCPQCGCSAISPIETEEIFPDAEEEEWEPAGYPRNPVEISPIAYDRFSHVAASVLPPLQSHTPVAAASQAKETGPEPHPERRPVAKSETFDSDSATQLDMFGQRRKSDGR